MYFYFPPWQKKLFIYLYEPETSKFRVGLGETEIFLMMASANFPLFCQFAYYFKIKVQQ